MTGFGLGLANLGTVFFILVALSLPSFQSVFVYAVNNFGVVITSFLVAVLIFKEPVNGKGWTGLALALASICLVYLGYR